VLLSLTEMAATRLRDARCCCGVVTVSIRNDNFRNYSHQRKLLVPTDITTSIYTTAKQLFDEAWEGEPVRHLGIRLSELCTNEFYQTSFFDEQDIERKRSLDRAIDGIRLKYGGGSVIRSRFLHSGIKPLQGGVGPDDYPLMTSIL
jgi:DNA polymerase-4